MSNFSIIAAVDQKFGLGQQGRMPWSLSADMQHFKEVTTGSAGLNMVIMGRKTWESLPKRFRPLPDRMNCVLTRQEEYPLPEGVLRAESLEDALDHAEQIQDRINDVFVAGGAQIYAQAIDRTECHSVYLTRIDQDFNCDVFFPQEKLKDYRQTVEGLPQKEGEVSFRFCQFERPQE